MGEPEYRRALKGALDVASELARVTVDDLGVTSRLGGVVRVRQANLDAGQLLGQTTS
jgi:hypothetical protein